MAKGHRPCSLGSMVRETESMEPTDEVLQGRMSNPAGCNASEPTGSLVSEELEWPTLWFLEEGWNTCPNPAIAGPEPTGGLPGYQGRHAREVPTDAEQDSN